MERERSGAGIDAFEANVHELHRRIPGAIYPRASDADEHHGYYRYHWAIHLDGDLVLAGFDVTATDAAGRSSRTDSHEPVKARREAGIPGAKRRIRGIPQASPPGC